MRQNNNDRLILDNLTRFPSRHMSRFTQFGLESTVLNILFFIRVTGDWKSSPEDVVEAGSLELFKLRLTSFFKFLISYQIDFFHCFIFVNVILIAIFILF